MNANLNTESQNSAARRKNRQRRKGRWLSYAGGIVLLALMSIGLWPQPLPVETARVTTGSLRATVNEEGKTRIKQRYLVSAPMAGQLRRIPFKAGAEVQEGRTVVAVIDPVAPALLDARSRLLAEARRDGAAAQLEKSRAQHDFAAAELRRAEKLFGEKTVAEQELEAARMREASTAREKSAAASTLRQAEVELAAYAPFGSETNGLPVVPIEIKAPASGRVLRVFEENSRPVAAGAPLLEIGDPTDLEVAVEVLSRDGATIQPGAAVELEQWGGGEPLTGRVRLVEPAAFTKISALGVEEQRVNVMVDLTTPPDRRSSLGDQFRVDARIVVWEATQALKAPSGALFRRGQQWAAFAVVNGRSLVKPVKIGRSGGGEIQILEGLQGGDEVILYPGDRIQAGRRVKPVDLSHK